MRAIANSFFVFLIAIAYSSAISCSLPAPRGNKVAPISTERKYNFIAVVVGEENAEAASVPVSGLIFRVLEADGPEPLVGTELTLIRYSIGTMCEKKANSLTLRDYPVGARVRVRSDDLFFADDIYYVD